jgi:hypothetical protein
MPPIERIPTKARQKPRANVLDATVLDATVLDATVLDDSSSVSRRRGKPRFYSTFVFLLNGVPVSGHSLLHHKEQGLSP